MTGEIVPLYGLVICGGESTRMGMDKSLLVYHDKPQRYHLYDLLAQVCDRVFISCNKKQESAISSAYNTIIDNPRYENIGPMAGVLSAFARYDQSDLMVVACDYPFISTADLEKLTISIKNHRKTTCYFNPDTGFEEPLLSVYLKDNYPDLIHNFNHKKYSLRSFLNEHNAVKIGPANSQTLLSIDTPEAYKQALDKIHLTVAHA